MSAQLHDDLRRLYDGGRSGYASPLVFYCSGLALNTHLGKTLYKSTETYMVTSFGVTLVEWLSPPNG